MGTVDRVRVELIGKQAYVHNVRGSLSNVRWEGPTIYRTYNELPNWVREGIAMLDLAAQDGFIFIELPDVGTHYINAKIYYLDYKGEE